MIVFTNVDQISIIQFQIYTRFLDKISYIADPYL